MAVQNALVLCEEIAVLLAKDAIEPVSNMASMRKQLCDHRDLVLRHLHLRLRVNWEKSKLSPIQKNDFLSRELDSESMVVHLTNEHAQSLLTFADDCMSSHSSTSIVKFADDTVVPGLISNNDETAYLDEVERLTSWCQDNCLSLNMSKTKELIVDFRKRQQQPYTPLVISGTPVERVSIFKYLGVNISEDLTWTTHIQTQVKKARQKLYHLQQLRKFRVSPAILKMFYSGAIESVLTQCISVWYSNTTNQDCKALQRVVLLAEHISGSALPSLQDIYLKRCKSRAVKIIKDSNHPGNHL